MTIPETERSMTEQELQQYLLREYPQEMLAVNGRNLRI